MAFRRTNLLTPARGSENFESAFQPNIGLKDGLASGRKHNRPKQAFGELKNVLHNHKPQNSNLMKKNIFQDFGTPKFEQKKNPIKFNVKDEFDDDDDFSYVTLPKGDFKSTEEYWAEKIAFSIEECDRILAPQFPRKKPITFDEGRRIMDYDLEDLRNDSLDKLLELDVEFDGINKLGDDELKIQGLGDIPLPSMDDWDLELLL